MATETLNRKMQFPLLHPSFHSVVFQWLLGLSPSLKYRYSGGQDDRWEECTHCQKLFSPRICQLTGLQRQREKMGLERTGEQKEREEVEYRGEKGKRSPLIITQWCNGNYCALWWLKKLGEKNKSLSQFSKNVKVKNVKRKPISLERKNRKLRHTEAHWGSIQRCSVRCLLTLLSKVHVVAPRSPDPSHLSASDLNK